MDCWDERYRAGEHRDDPPSPRLVQAVATLPPGRALDLACGPGRNALWLAAAGWRVTAVDRSGVALAMLRERALQLGLEVDTRRADLERGEFTIPPDSFDLICDFHYLQSDLFPEIRAGLRPGGLAVAAIHLVDATPGLRPMNRVYLLEPGELRNEFPGWEILHYSEGAPPGRRAVAEIVARRPVRSPPLLVA